MDPNAARVARNEATFREANERIEEAAAEGTFDRVPFICECAEEGCTAIVALRLSEYEQVRKDPRWFACLPGHERSQNWSRVVSEGEGYVVVEKVGDAAEIVEALDPRGEEVAG